MTGAAGTDAGKGRCLVVAAAAQPSAAAAAVGAEVVAAVQQQRWKKPGQGWEEKKMCREVRFLGQS